MTYNATALLVLMFVSLGAAGALAVLVRRKHRLIWKEIWSIRQDVVAIEDGNIELRKKVCLASFVDLRLPPLMPSQHGEDLLLWGFFDRRRKGFYVELGAYDGVAFSNTYFLEALGWEGILIEPNPGAFESCIRNRPYSRCIHGAITCQTQGPEIMLSLVEGNGGIDTLSYTVESTRHLSRVVAARGMLRTIRVPALRLADVLKDVEHSIDLISIDVEGAELDVLQSLDFEKHGPRVFVIEDNSLGQERQVNEFLTRRGYVERLRHRANVFYTRREDATTFAW
jgi:FkbM family methyltransferase